MNKFKIIRNKKTILFFLLLNTSISMAQSKKDQIETLKLRIDSLNSVIYVERNSSSQNILNLDSKISVLEAKIDSLSLMLKNNKDSLYKKELECSNFNTTFGIINNDLAILETRLDSLKKVQSKNIEEINNADEIITSEFVKKFYSSLELTPELNKKHYIEGGVKFNMNKFNSCIDINSIYSKKRISNLTGDYHDAYNIKLLNFDSLRLNNNIIELIAIVEYQVYEVGTFQNEEKLIININQGNLTLKKWVDLKVKKMVVAEYEGLENFKEVDFYKMLGSLNK